VQRQAVVRTIPLPELASDQGRGAVALSADEKTLAVVTNSGLSVVHLDRMAQQGAYSVWSQPSAMPLDGLGAWTAIANDAAAGSGQQPASYLYGQYFTFIGSSSLGMVGLVTQPSGKFAVFSVVDPDGTQHVAAVRFNWTAGRLYFPFVYQLAPGSWGAWVYDNSAATWVPIGLLTLPADFGRLAPASMTLSTWVGAPAPACSSYPSADVLYYPAQGYVGGTGAVATLATSGQTPGECPASATVAHGVWAYHHLGT
jgi:hypothetical protein